MPQMMPINWILLFMFFNMIFLLFIIMNYYNYNINKTPNTFFLMKKNKNLSWKW